MPSPRRVAKDVFNVSRTDRADAPTQVAPAPLESLLPRREVATPRRAPGSAPPATAAAYPSAAPRGVGGGPWTANETGRITRVPARVPSALYEAALPLVKGVGKPSRGQLVAWTCQDHETVVRAQIATLAAAAASPRRVRGQNREGEATVQVTPAFTVGERVVFEGLREKAQQDADVPMTRTMVVTAALKVATSS